MKYTSPNSILKSLFIYFHVLIYKEFTFLFFQLNRRTSAVCFIKRQCNYKNVTWKTENSEIYMLLSRFDTSDRNKESY